MYEVLQIMLYLYYYIRYDDAMRPVKDEVII